MLLWSDGKFGLNEDDEVRDAGGEHARQSDVSDREHSISGDRLGVVDNVYSRGWDKARKQQYSLLLIERRKIMISWFFNEERQNNE